MATMKININTFDPSPEVEALMTRAINFGAKRTPTNSGVTLEVSSEKTTQAQFDFILAQPNLTVDDAVLYVRVPQSSLDNLVDVDLPDSKYIDEEGVEQRRNYLDYFTTPKLNKAGDEALVRVAHRKLGAPNPIDLAKDAEIRAWLAVFGSLITVQEYDKLLTTDEWEQEGLGE